MLKKWKKHIGMSLMILQVLSVTNVYANPVMTNKDGVILVGENNTYEKTKYYKDNLLGIAGGFNLVGFESVERSSDVQGNILTDTLIANGNFGTNGIEEVSYFRKLKAQNQIQTIRHNNSILVVGKNLKIGKMDNDNYWTINNLKVDNRNRKDKPESLWQDDEKEFVDLEKVKAESINLVNQLLDLDNHGTEIVNSDQNNQEIKVLGSEQFNVYNMNPGDFNLGTPIKITGFNKDQASTLVINVDMSKIGGGANFSIPRSNVYDTSGKNFLEYQYDNGVRKWLNANVIWNIYDSSKKDNLYRGTIEDGGVITGIILSPDATVSIGHDHVGNIIANNIKTFGSTFRDDYTGPGLKKELKAIKIHPSEAELTVGQVLELEVVTDPLGILVPNLLWSSNDSSVASVDENGNVLALKQGKAVITVKTEGGLQATSNITVKSLLNPTDISRPDLAGYGFMHPLSVSRITMEMAVESEINQAKLTMEFSYQDIVIDPNFEVVVKIDGIKIDSSRYMLKDIRTIDIELGNLVGRDTNPGTYKIDVYLKMKPSGSLKNINDYHTEANNNKLIDVTNTLEGSILIGEGQEDITMYLEPYQLELIKIPHIN